MFEYAGIHNTCNLHDMLDSKVLKTHFRKKKYVYAIYLAWATIYQSYTGISCHAPAWFWIDFSLPFGKSRMLGSDRRHIPNTLHGFPESEFDKSLFRQWLANNGYIKVYLKDETAYTAYILVYTRYIYCQTPPLLWIRLCRPCDADGSQPHAPCLLRSLRPASRMSAQHSDHPGGACHEQNSTATG